MININVVSSIGDLAEASKIIHYTYTHWQSVEVDVDIMYAIGFDPPTAIDEPVSAAQSQIALFLWLHEWSVIQNVHEEMVSLVEWLYFH